MATVLDNAFCTFLEYRLSALFENIKKPETKGFWCDGVVFCTFAYDCSKKQISADQAIILKAFTGKTGQTEYLLSLQFGKKALNRYARNLRIEDCVPQPQDTHMCIIDTINCTITLKLY